MRVREWYGWHFPEMAKIVNDNLQYARVVLKAGVRKNMSDMDFSDILPEDVEENMKKTCEISMGTDISESDVTNLSALCTQVISLSEYRAKLFDYLKNRMAAIAPNLSVMVGDLVGARLIAHAGSLMNLAKAPASTVQILGAEKALFRALKTKHDTPKYGLIYHASLIGQSAPKNKGKISRVLAAKTSLAIRVDALGETSEATIGFACREKVEARLRQLETGKPYSLESAKKKVQKYDKEEHLNGNGTYNNDADNTMDTSEEVATPAKKAKEVEDSSSSSDDESDKKKKKKKDKKEKKEKKKKKKKTDERTHRSGWRSAPRSPWRSATLRPLCGSCSHRRSSCSAFYCCRCPTRSAMRRCASATRCSSSRCTPASSSPSSGSACSSPPSRFCRASKLSRRSARSTSPPRSTATRASSSSSCSAPSATRGSLALRARSGSSSTAFGASSRLTGCSRCKLRPPWRRR
mmetsp:Transcript_1229/g.3766  ORF Transcript_1229/g.3766 Transcript_1229/m.3766 type:complete len:465 (-) Transcript_1229:748-2142(-)